MGRDGKGSRQPSKNPGATSAQQEDGNPSTSLDLGAMEDSGSGVECALSSPGRVRLVLDLDQGRLEGLPIAEILQKLFVEEAGKEGGSAKVFAKCLAQARKGRDSIPVEIEIKDTGDKSLTLSRPHKQSLEMHSRKSNKRYSWARKRASNISAMVDVQKITISIDVGVREESDETDDDKREPSDQKKEITSDTGSNHVDERKKKKKEKKSKPKDKKKRKEKADEKKSGKEEHSARAPLTKTVSGRRLLLNGSRISKEDSSSAYRKTFSLVDVRAFFKRDDKEVQGAKKDEPEPAGQQVPQDQPQAPRDQPHVSKDQPQKPVKKERTSESAPSTMEITVEAIQAARAKAVAKAEHEAKKSSPLRLSQSDHDLGSKTDTKSAAKPVDTVTVDTTPWLIPELTEAEKSAQKTKASGDSVHATIPSTLFATAETHPLLPVYFSKSPIAHTWQYITFADLYALVRRVGRALMALGMPPRARTALISSNRLEWAAFYLGTMSAAGVPVGLPTVSEAETTRMLTLVQASVVVVEKREQCDALLSQKEHLPDLRHIVLLDGSASGCPPGLVLTWRQLLAKGTYGNVNNSEFQRRLATVNSSDLATLAFTSGTTGQAKCVMLSHSNLLFSAKTVAQLLAIEESDSMVSFLPPSHITEQVLSIHVPIISRCRVYFAESTAKLSRNMREIQPTLIFAPPELWRKIYIAVQAKVPQSTAQSIGAHAISTLWASMGFARIRYAACAYGHLPEDVNDYMQKLNMTLHEAYGQTETCGLASLNLAGMNQVGTVGKVLPGTEAKVDAEGQILIKGEHICMGYISEDKLPRPRDEWWPTGDHASIDEHGFIHLVGRQVELITSLGDKVLHPEKLENALKMLPVINNVIVFGHRKPYLTAVISLDPFFMARLSKEKGVAAKALYKAPYINEITVAIQKHVIAVNRRQPRGYPTLKRFTVLRKQFSLEKGELAPSMQIRRFVVEKNYEKEIDKMYADTPSTAPKKPAPPAVSPAETVTPESALKEAPPAVPAVTFETGAPQTGEAPNEEKGKTPDWESDSSASLSPQQIADPRRGTAKFYNMLKMGASRMQSPQEQSATSTPSAEAENANATESNETGSNEEGRVNKEEAEQAPSTPAEPAAETKEIPVTPNTAESTEHPSQESSANKEEAEQAPSTPAEPAAETKEIEDPSQTESSVKDEAVPPAPSTPAETKELPVAQAEAFRPDTTPTEGEPAHSPEAHAEEEEKRKTDEGASQERSEEDSSREPRGPVIRPVDNDVSKSEGESSESEVDREVPSETSDTEQKQEADNRHEEREVTSDGEGQMSSGMEASCDSTDSSLTPQEREAERGRREKERQEREEKKRLGQLWEKEKELSESEERKLEEERRAQARRELIERKVDMKSTVAMFQMLAKTSGPVLPQPSTPKTRYAARPTTPKNASSSSASSSSPSPASSPEPRSVSLRNSSPPASPSTSGSVSPREKQQS